MTLPVGDGIGATQVAKATKSSFRAAGRLLIITVADPLAISPGPAGTQLGSMHGLDISETRAAPLLLIFTVGEHGGMIFSGIAGCATGVGVGAGGWIGAWQCGESCFTLSPIRAAFAPMSNTP